jgi:malate dehydrogenase
VPLPRFTCVAGIPITKLLSKERLDAIVDRTRNGGSEIVSLLKTGSAYYAPALAVKEMAEAILKDKKKILPCSAYLEGEYGVNGLFVGVPVKLGSEGVEQIIEVELTESEKKAFKKSADDVRGLVKIMKGFTNKAQAKVSVKHKPRPGQKSKARKHTIRQDDITVPD